MEIKKQINRLLAALKDRLSLRNSFYLIEDGITDESSTIFSRTVQSFSSANSLPEGSVFGLIYVDHPFGQKKEPSVFDPKTKVDPVWNRVAIYSSFLEDDGLLILPLLSSFFDSIQSKSFRKDLESRGLWPNMIINSPKNILYPFSSIRPILVGFQKAKSNHVFIGELNEGNENLLAMNFANRLGVSLNNGKWISRDSFRSFQKLIIEEQLDGLKTQFRDYERYKLGDVVDEINTTNESFKKIENSLYLTSIGKFLAFTDPSNTTVKQKHLFQIVVNPQIVLANYLELYFKSELGSLSLEMLKSGDLIQRLRKLDLKDVYLAIPSLKEQKLLVKTSDKLGELEDYIVSLRMELSLNPKTANKILDEYESIATPLRLFSKEDEILSLIRKGENKTVEFKETFSKNIHTNQKDKDIEKSSLKNIVGFLNADGGTLLIGIADDGSIEGLEKDFYKNKDSFLLNFKNALHSKIGSEFYPLIDFEVYFLFEKPILRVDCMPSNDPCFLDGKEFFVRTNPATDKLEGKKLMDYCKLRFEG